MPSKSKAQHRLMAAVAHDPAFAKRASIPVSVGQDFVAADKRKGYAEGGRVGMEHRQSKGQDASTQPLTGSALKALVRGWIAGTAGLPGDVEGLGRALINKSFSYPGHENPVDSTPALPTSEFYKEWLPGKQQGDEMINDIGSAFGGVGATKPVSLGKGALSRYMAAAPSPRAGSMAAQRGVIKAPGGNWLSGSIEDALKRLKNPYVDKYKQAVAWYGPDKAGQYVANPGASAEALNTWIDKKLANYVRNDMATERDPIRALAEQGVLHDNLDPFGPVAGETVSALRSEAGFPVSGSGKSDLAKTWENVSDAMLRQKPASYYQQGIGEVDNWLTKLSPETAIYQAKDNAFTSNLGFDHLMDELRNAVDVNSGLPPQLRLKPEDLAKVSVPQAVQRVAQINQWRADQKVAADLARANNAATVLHKEYPEKGYKWVELSKPPMPEGWQAPPRYSVVRPTPGAESLAIKDNETGRYITTGLKSEAQAKAHLYDTLNKADLADALKYEGDTMGHCVGGYCEDVASGNSRIYSLRDAKGQPHVTIEVQPQKRWNTDTIPNTEEDTGQRIVQIKGKQNRKPNDEYLPFVQDFVKSGKWSYVGDLQNTGLIRPSTMFNDSLDPSTNKIFGTLRESFPGRSLDKQKAQELLGNDLLTEQEAIDKLSGYFTSNPEGFADGGSVSGKAPTWQDAFDEFQKAHQAQFGIGIDRPWAQDEDAARAKQQIDQKYIDALKAYDPTLAPDASVLGVNAQPNAYVPKPDRGGWFSQQLSNIGNIFRPVVQSVDDFGKDARSAVAGTIDQAAKLGSEATGGIVSPDAAKVAALIAYIAMTGDVASAMEAETTAGEVFLGAAPEFAWADTMANPSFFQAPAISAGGAPMSDAVLAGLTGQGSHIGLNLANVGQSANEIMNAADLQKFLGGQTSGLIGNTAASAAGPFAPVVNIGSSVFKGMPVGQAATNAVGSAALGKAIQGVAKQTGLPTAVVGAGANYGITGNAPTASDTAKIAISLYSNTKRQPARARQTRTS